MTPYFLFFKGRANSSIILERVKDSSNIEGINIIFSPDHASLWYCSGAFIASLSSPNPLIKNESSLVVADINTR